jgi:hypothetical protein
MMFVPDADLDIWVRVRCISPFCGNQRVLPLAPWRIRWGVANPTPMMRRHFRCGACGRKGCEFETARRGTGKNGEKAGFKEEYPLSRGLTFRAEHWWPLTRIEADRQVHAA